MRFGGKISDWFGKIPEKFHSDQNFYCHSEDCFMKTHFEPNYSGLQIYWGGREKEIEFISPEVLQCISSMTAARCFFRGELVAYNYPVKAFRDGSKLILRYTEDSPNWPQEAEWSVIQCDLVVTFSDLKPDQPNQIYWKEISGGFSCYPLREGKDWKFQLVENQFSVKTKTRDHVLRNVFDRSGQSLLRAQLISSSDSCEISKTTCVEALEACHILPVKNGGLDILENALLLRRDLHALFDSGLLRFKQCDDRWLVDIDKSVDDLVYRQFDGIELQNSRLIQKTPFLEARNSLTEKEITKS